MIKKTTEFLILDMETYHVNDVYSIECEVFQHDSWSKSMFFSELSNKHKYYVALCGKELVGYCGLHIHDSTADLQTLTVKSDYRKRGIGQILLNTLLEVCAKAQVINLYLEVREDNDAAISLYKKNNFIIFDKRIKYYNDGMNAICMMKKMSVL